jgi:lysophospholipase L1-like esterase
LPLTLVHFGDSLTEAVDTAVEGYGWAYMARERVSSLTTPVEICNLAAASTTTTEFRARAEQLLPLLLPEAVVCAVFTPNGIVAPNFTDTGNARLMYRNTQAIKTACAAVNATFIGWSGVPMLSTSPDTSTGYKDLDAAGAAALNRYMSAVLSTTPVINSYAAVSGTADADGQMRLALGTAAGNLHINATGHALAATPYETFLRANLPR